MLEVFASIAGPCMLSITGFYIIKKVTNSQEKLLCIKNLLLLSLLSIITIVLYKSKYTGLEQVVILISNIIIYKIIFGLSFESGLIVTGIVMVAIAIGDMISGMLLVHFYSAEQVRSAPFLALTANVIVSLVDIGIINIKLVKTQLVRFYNYCQKRQSVVNAIFLVVLVIGLYASGYNIASAKEFDIKYVFNMLLVISLCITAYIFIKNKNNYNQLTDEYDNLFSYVQNFEDWIEKEQLNRHEYKNQLAVLYCLTKEKAVKDKINEILDDNINIEGTVINELKLLPKGGIKGLMYYKVAVAQKKKVNVTADVSLESKGILSTLKEKDIRVICKLLGIYLDNAIEAAEETRKKALYIEVYELSNKVCFTISNSFKKKSNFDDRNKKGVSSKGEGRGNGLYFASKVLEANKWLESSQDVVDKFYIQKLTINKKI